MFEVHRIAAYEVIHKQFGMDWWNKETFASPKQRKE
jgi:hypothetical protein